MLETENVKNFIEQRIEEDLKNNTYGGKVTTRFPPEPNGYLHIGHAKSICLNFGMAKQYNGNCHLRFDDTNPSKEDIEYVNAIQADVKWLGFEWDYKHYAADYFEQLYDYAVALIKSGDAFVCSLNAEQMREYRGTLTEPGKNSPDRDRPIAENLDLFARMRAGEFNDGQYVLRAKIDMASGNINMRDPVIYRIMKVPHQHTGDKWCIYPMYDFAHCLSDAIEKITHSLCTLEFQDHRPLYDWFVEKLTPAPRPQQIEFSRLNLTHTLTSKRNLKRCVDDGIVDGWDDPRMPTLVGMRRRGFTPAAIRQFCKLIGISKSDSVIDMSLLEECVRDDLNKHALRAMCVLNPLKITIANLPDGHLEHVSAPNHPQDESLGSREIAFTKEIFIEQDDFAEIPPKKYKRLTIGNEIRLRNAYVIKCKEIIKDPKTGSILELICEYDPDTLGKNPPERKVSGVIHWVSATHAKECEVRLFDRLFQDPNPGKADSWESLLKLINPESKVTLKHCYLEANLPNLEPETRYQFERLGYFVVDRMESSADRLIFNRIVGLRDTWANT